MPHNNPIARSYRSWFLMYIGLGFVFGFASVALWPIRIMAEVTAVAAGICFIGAVCAVPGFLKERSARDKYDLKSLNELHDREELDRINQQDSLDFDSVHCLACGEVYNIRMPVCPRCGASPGRLG